MIVWKEFKMAEQLTKDAWECRADWMTEEMVKDHSLVISDIIRYGIESEMETYLEESGLATANWTEEEFEEYIERVKWCHIGMMEERLRKSTLSEDQISEIGKWWNTFETPDEDDLVEMINNVMAL